MTQPTITDAFRCAREAAATARALLDREEGLLCAELGSYRKAQGMTQEQVSELVGLSRTQITNIEAGRGVSVEALLAYAAVVGCRLVLQPTDDSPSGGAS